MNGRFSRVLSVAALCGALATPSYAVTGVKISEWMYNGSEFVELTNFGPNPVDFTGWRFDDLDKTTQGFSLTGFGIVVPGASVILTEDPADAFRALWSIPVSVKILGGNEDNLARNDEINIYDGANTLVDRLQYGDQTFPGSIRTASVSGQPITLAALGANDVYQWKLSVAGDAGGSYAVGTLIGNPGIAPVPEPETYAMMMAGLALVGFALRRRQATRA
jgi:predicted extracellular nuclease